MIILIVSVYRNLLEDMVLNLLIDPSYNLDAKGCFAFHDQCVSERENPWKGKFLLK